MSTWSYVLGISRWELITMISNMPNMNQRDSKQNSSWFLSIGCEMLQIGAIFLWLSVYNIIRISSSKVANDDSENGNLPITDTPEETSKTLPGPNIGGPISTQDSTTTEHLEDHHVAPSSRADELNAQPKVTFFLSIWSLDAHFFVIFLSFQDDCMSIAQ
jgi:hypothetical protein